MLISQGDLPVVSWARDRGYAHYYCQESGLPDPCLKVHLGQVAACFHDGALVRLTFQVDGELVDEMFHHLHELLELCEESGAYLEQQPVTTARGAVPVCFSRN